MNLNATVLKSFFLTIIIICPLLALDTPTVSVSPDTSGYYGEYSVSSRLQNPFPLLQVEANIDSLVIVFNSGTTLPVSIDPSYVTVNGIATSGIDVSGQRVSILSPIELRNYLGGNQDFTIVISEAAKIRNPSSSGNYTLSVIAVQSSGGIMDGPATSNTYSITTSSSTIAQPTVAPSPTIVGQAAAYNISFDVGKGGYLTAGVSTITVGFDPVTTVPNGSLSGITINSTPATATAYNDTVVITTPTDIDNQGTVNLVFAQGSGLFNPVTGGNYTLGVKTSSENTFIEADSFTIVNMGQFAISAVNFNPTTVNRVSEYVIDFVTSSSGALSANSDTIALFLPANTYIPEDISNSDILLSSGGFSDNVSFIDIYNSVKSDEDTLFFVPSINVGSSSNATITLSSSAGILNPSESGAYEIRLRTSQDTGIVQSNSYLVTNSSTTVSQSIVTPTSTSTDAVTSYTVDFNIGAEGRLQSGVSTIMMVFNSAFTISETLSDYNQSTITINNGTPVNIPTVNIVPSDAQKSVVITLPSGTVTENSDNIVLFLSGTGINQPITNPASSGNYTVNLSTSVEETQVLSATYSIGGTAVTNSAISLLDASVNSVSQYTVSFTLSTTLNTLVDDYVKVIFPEGTVLPSNIATSDITVNGSNPKFVTVVPSTRTVTAAISQFFISAGSTVTIVFNSSIGIINPVVPSDSFYKVAVSTSKDIVAVSSPFYSITGDNTRTNYVSASVNPSVRGIENVAYSVTFTTSSTGKLKSNTSAGSSTITVQFDTVTVVPAMISAGNIKVNSFVSQAVNVVTSGNGGEIEVTLPESMTIENNSTVTVSFDSSAGLDTRDFSGTYDLRIKTSSDTVYSDASGTAGDYIIENDQDLSFTSVTCNPSFQNANAAYSIKFTNGSAGLLEAGENIYLIFPGNTFVPSAMSMSDILVNGNALTSNPTINGDTLIIPTPITLDGLTDVTILINQSAGILNPTLVQSYVMQLYSATEPGPYSSPAYNITKTTSTVAPANITLETSNPATTSKYTVNFSTGSSGRLIDGTSTVSITFNANTIVNRTASNYDSTYIIVNGSATQINTSNISIDNQEVTLIIPAGVSIGNNENISIILNRTGTSKPITNPDTDGSYTLQVKTSVENTNITSNQYIISSISAITNITVDVSPEIVNATSTDTINFRVQQNLDAGTGTITITFPFNTLIPANISTSYVRIANGANPTSFANVSDVQTNSATQTVTCTVPNNIISGDSVRVAFLTQAGIENPSVFGDYNVNVRTSAQPLDGTSADYTLSSTTTTISNLSFNIEPRIPGAVATYTFNFITGSRGRLISGVSKISLLISKDAVFTLGTPQPSKVTVNSIAADAVELNTAASPDPDTLVVTVPSSVTIGNSTQVTVVIDESAGLQNASATYALTYGAFTSVEFNTQTSDFSLPVELTSFLAENSGSHVLIKWTTQSEIENAYWFIERREIEDYEIDDENNLNPDPLNMNFERIAQIAGMGNKASQTDYKFVDSTAITGKTYAYRLVDISYNGITTYHDVFYLEVDLPVKFALFQNFPNPFNPITNIKYSLPVAAEVKISIYNVLGQKIIDLVNKSQEAGNYTVQWDGMNRYNQRLASGFFVYRLQWKSSEGNQGSSKWFKMILLK